MSAERDSLRGSYWLTRVVFLRFLSALYVVVFAISYLQNKQLIGQTGLLPLSLFLKNIEHNYINLQDKILNVPTFFWFVEAEQVNWFLDATAFVGMFISIIIFITGGANSIALASLWLLYFSIVSVGQTWYSFGWESQILEINFLAIWLVPFFEWDSLPKSFPTPWLVVIGYRWLIFRIMIGAGLIKVRGDECWRDLTCMNYFYETQPVPNPISYYVHQSPEIIHKIETIGNHVVELVIPWFILLPHRYCNLFVGYSQILFQFLIILTGNLSFLNWLTIIPTIFIFDDYTLQFLFKSKICNKVMKYNATEKTGIRKFCNCEGYLSTFRVLVNIAIGCHFFFLIHMLLF
jgi:hypothetical protein